MQKRVMLQTQTEAKYSVAYPLKPSPCGIRKFFHVAYLPSGWTVAVAFILEIRNKANHPVINLGQGESLLGGALDGTGDEVCIWQVSPRVPPGGLGFAQLAGHVERSPGHAGRSGHDWGRGAGWVLDLRRCATFSLGPACGHVILLHFDRCQGQTSARLFSPGEILWTRQRPGARPRPAVRLKFRIDINLMRIHAAVLHHHQHDDLPLNRCQNRARSLQQKSLSILTSASELKCPNCALVQRKKKELYCFTQRDDQPTWKSRQRCGILSFSLMQQCGITSGQMKVYPRHQQQYQSLFHVNCTTPAVWLHAGPSDGQTSIMKARHTWRMSLSSLRLQQQLIPLTDEVQSRLKGTLINSQINWLYNFLQGLISAFSTVSLQIGWWPASAEMKTHCERNYSLRNRNRLSWIIYMKLWISRREKKSPHGFDLEHPLCLLCTPPDASLRIVDISTFVFSFPFTCHMGTVSLPIALPLYYKYVCLWRLQAT